MIQIPAWWDDYFNNFNSTHDIEQRVEYIALHIQCNSVLTAQQVITLRLSVRCDLTFCGLLLNTIQITKLIYYIG